MFALPWRMEMYPIQAVPLQDVWFSILLVYLLGAASLAFYFLLIKNTAHSHHIEQPCSQEKLELERIEQDDRYNFASLMFFSSSVSQWQVSELLGEVCPLFSIRCSTSLVHISFLLRSLAASLPAVLLENTHRAVFSWCSSAASQPFSSIFLQIFASQVKNKLR